MPIAFGWDKNGARLSPPEDATLSIRSNDQYSSTLIIDRLQFGHRGNYTCTASNAAGSATYTAELTVNGTARRRIICRFLLRAFRNLRSD